MHSKLRTTALFRAFGAIAAAMGDPQLGTPFAIRPQHLGRKPSLLLASGVETQGPSWAGRRNLRPNTPRKPKRRRTRGGVRRMVRARGRT